ncbi:MAG: phosphoenolpyruvate-utilizing N-terminal domain-containing protein, partial [Candidatus Cloacimonadota bacterium]|nr:phosphoenolpyruvate-utilizing N-terminal domain-containing protein [Candidatus Cloacimonadota bacterium]
MKIIEGLPVSPGIAIGNAVLKKEKIYKIDKQNIHYSLIQSEISLLEEALDNVIEQIKLIIDSEESTKDDREILEVHKEILRDQTLFENISNLIKDEYITKEHAVYKHFKILIEHFENVKNDIFKQRASDYKDVASRLISNLLGEDRDYFAGLDKNSILVTSDISPSYVSTLSKIPIKAMCTEKGSRTSHSSIIARAVQLPTVIKVENISSFINDGDEIIVDGYTGKVYINPDKKIKNMIQTAKIGGKLDLIEHGEDIATRKTDAIKAKEKYDKRENEAKYFTTGMPSS